MNTKPLGDSDATPLVLEQSIELMKRGHGDPSFHLTFSTTVQMSRVGERSCLYCTLSAVQHLWTNSMARGLSVIDEDDQVDVSASGKKSWAR